MFRFRLGFVALSLMVVLLFAGVLTASRAVREDLFRALGNLAEVVHLVQAEYVEELDPQALAVALDAGIVESVDWWAAVLPADRAEVYRQMVAGPPPFGLGLAKRFSSASVRHTLAGSPARLAGLDQWEVIELVDGVNTRGRPLWELRLELHDKLTAGEPVELTIVDRQVDVRRTVTLEPTPWTPEPAAVELVDGVQVVRLESLPQGAAGRIASMVDADAPVVLDLRSLIWGLESEAVAVADLFVSEGLLGEWRGRRAGEATFEATAGATVLPAPRAVVVGGDTEGVGEILAAAMQRAGVPLVGASATIGHAPHMQFVHEGDLTLWIPVGLWLRADAEPIADGGVEPDELVEVDPAAGEDGEEDAPDVVLERAIGIAAAGAALEPAA